MTTVDQNSSLFEDSNSVDADEYDRREVKQSYAAEKNVLEVAFHAVEDAGTSETVV